MAKAHVLVTVPYMGPGDKGDQLLHEAGIETHFNLWHGDRTEEEMIQLLTGMDAAVVGIDPFTDKVMAGSPQLKVISRSGVGYDSVDVPAATAHGVAVCITPGANHHSVAEHAMGLMLQCSRKLMENLVETRNGGWKSHQGFSLVGRTLGIIGLGAIGKQVAIRARAFQMRVIAFDPIRDEAFAAANQVTFVSLEQLLRESDFVSVHCFLNDETRHLINAERLRMMKPTAYVINTARGPIVDEEAICEAVKVKVIAGAALDVFAHEPLPADSPLRKVDKIYLTSHASGATSDAREASVVMASENVARILARSKPLSCVNPEVLKRLGIS
jgi:phosphoglycerate dehydrogenase-like enzyme